MSRIIGLEETRSHSDQLLSNLSASHDSQFSVARNIYVLRNPSQSSLDGLRSLRRDLTAIHNGNILNSISSLDASKRDFRPSITRSNNESERSPAGSIDNRPREYIKENYPDSVYNKFERAIGSSSPASDASVEVSEEDYDEESVEEVTSRGKNVSVLNQATNSNPIVEISSVLHELRSLVSDLKQGPSPTSIPVDSPTSDMKNEDILEPVHEVSTSEGKEASSPVSTGKNDEIVLHSPSPSSSMSVSSEGEALPPFESGPESPAPVPASFHSAPPTKTTKAAATEEVNLSGNWTHSPFVSSRPPTLDGVSRLRSTGPAGRPLNSRRDNGEGWEVWRIPAKESKEVNFNSRNVEVDINSVDLSALSLEVQILSYSYIIFTSFFFFHSET